MRRFCALLRHLVLRWRAYRSARQHPAYWRHAAFLTQFDRCFMCKHRFERALIHEHGINGEYAFHVEATHGIPKEVLADWINDRLVSAYAEPLVV